MLNVRRHDERGYADHGWLRSRHTFSFANYHDPRHMGFRDLRVINDDRVAPGHGFGTHPHRDMEIISYVLEGAMEHRDSLGTGSVIRPGEVQRMTAGTGVLHSEFNHSKTDVLRFLQIWIIPAENDLQPGYEQTAFPRTERQDRLRLVVSPDGRDGSVTVHQDVNLYAGSLSPGAEVTHERGPDRHVWLQVANGRLRAGDHELVEGDGLWTSDEPRLTLTGVDDSEVLLFDLR